MDSSSVVPFAALLIGAIIIVIVLLRIMRARHRRHAEAEQAPLTVDEEEYLDSSHIGGPIAPKRNAGNKRQS